jgi:hypothetical protein
VAVPITLAPATGHPRPDLVFKRRDTQQLFYDDHVPAAPLSARSIYSWFDVTGAVTGTGFVFHDVAPGQSFTVAVQISGVGARDAGALTAVGLHSGSAPELVDYTRLWVSAPTSG